MSTDEGAEGRGRNRRAGKSAEGQSSGANPAVGYGRPPSHTRFKPGKTGNPHGRPRGSRNLKTIIQSALTSRIVLREGGNRRSISKLEGIVLRQLESALKGNEKAALTTLKMAAQLGLLEGSDSETETATLSATEQAMLDELFARNTVKRKRRTQE